jgi:hypothetical protein
MPVYFLIFLGGVCRPSALYNHQEGFELSAVPVLKQFCPSSTEIMFGRFFSVCFCRTVTSVFLPLAAAMNICILLAGKQKLVN